MGGERRSMGMILKKEGSKREKMKDTTRMRILNEAVAVAPGLALCNRAPFISAVGATVTGAQKLKTVPVIITSICIPWPLSLNVPERRRGGWGEPD